MQLQRLESLARKISGEKKGKVLPNVARLIGPLDLLGYHTKNQSGYISKFPVFHTAASSFHNCATCAAFLPQRFTSCEVCKKTARINFPPCCLLVFLSEIIYTGVYPPI